MAHSWKAGAAATVITPSESMWLAGWAARRQPAQGRAQDLFAKALALKDPLGRLAVIITADLIAIPRELASLVAEKIRERWGIPRECLLLNASHTHTAPEVRPDKVPFFDIPPEFALKIGPYVSSLVEKLTATAEAALNALQPAVLSVHQTAVELAKNRRPLGGPVDWTVPILEFTRTDSRPLATLFSYACHNLTLPPEFCFYHGDYAGVAQAELEKKWPGATALFLSGAGADQDPAPRGKEELVNQHGRTLATAITTALAQPGRNIKGELRAAFDEVELDFMPLPSIEALETDATTSDLPRARKAKFLQAALGRGEKIPEHYRCPVQVLRFGGEFLLIALGGEPVVDYALQFRSEFTGPLVCVAGYCNDGFGYLPNRRVQSEGGYEGGRSLFWSALPGPFTDTVEERIRGAVRRLVGKVSGS